jgi:hypothetical protein
MKKSLLNLSVLLFAFLFFAACKKDEPTFTDKIVGEWHSVNVKLNGNDVTGYFALDLELQADKDFKATLKTVNLVTGKIETTYPRGEWEADNNSQEFDLTYSDTGETENYEVLEFSDDEMTVETLQGTDIIQITFERSE